MIKNQNIVFTARNSEDNNNLKKVSVKSILPRNRKTHDSDSEYQPRTDGVTEALTVQLSTTEDNGSVRSDIWQHPTTRKDYGDNPKYPYFKTPWAILDFEGYTTEGEHWRWSEKTSKENHIFSMNFFLSLHDINFSFAEQSVFRCSVLPYIRKTRRHSIRTVYNRPYAMITHPQKGCLQIYKERARDGKKAWHNVSLEIFDMSALMGAGGLHKYASMVGLDMPFKDTYNNHKYEMSKMLFEDDGVRFRGYGLGDVVGRCIKTGEDKQLLREIFYRYTDQMNGIATLLGANPRNDGWGMSTGTVVARLVSEAIANKLGVTVEQLSSLTAPGGYESLNHLGKVVNKNKDAFVYLTMVDGGRASSERLLPPGASLGGKHISVKTKGTYTGVLVDIDISGCYGNGLLNQIFPIGVPQVVDKKMSLREFIKDIRPRTVPGCWYARISWKNAPFACDVLVSKVGKSFRSWDWAVDGFGDDGFEYEEPDDKAYDASMALFTHECHQAALNHDLLQILETSAQRKNKGFNNKSEWEWLLDNAVIEGCVYYDKRYRTEEITSEMMEGYQLNDGKNTALTACKNWVGFPLSEIVGILIPQRMLLKRLHGGKSNEQNFLKLVINTIYGCIASIYFNNDEACISNVVAGNNITARARALAWCMAKGLGCFQLITDGGMFDLNEVILWRKGRMSLNALANTYTDTSNDIHGNKCYDRVPLLGRVVTEDECREYKKNNLWVSKERKDSDWNKPTNTEYLQEKIDVNAWKHLVETFPKLDIFAGEGQFWFETKRVFTGFTPHNKVNYRMTNIILGDNDKEGFHIAFRGMRKEDGRADELFDAYEKGEPIEVVINRTELLSLNDWNDKNDERKNELLPFDQVSVTKKFYSITPLSYRPQTQAEFIGIDIKYQEAKKSDDPAMKVAEVLTTNLTQSQYGRINRRLVRIK